MINKYIKVDYETNELDESLFRTLPLEKLKMHNYNKDRFNLITELNKSRKIPEKLRSNKKYSFMVGLNENVIDGYVYKRFPRLQRCHYLLDNKGKRISNKKYTNLRRTIQNMIIASNGSNVYILNRDGKNVLYQFSDVREVNPLNENCLYFLFDTDILILNVKTGKKLQLIIGSNMGINMISNTLVNINGYIIDLKNLNVIYDENNLAIKQVDSLITLYPDFCNVKILDLNKPGDKSTLKLEERPEEINVLPGRCALYKQQGKYGITNFDLNRVVVPFEYDRKILDYYGYVILYNYNKYVLYDIKKACIVKAGNTKFKRSQDVFKLNDERLKNLRDPKIICYGISIDIDGVSRNFEFNTIEELENLTLKDISRDDLYRKAVQKLYKKNY